MWGLGSTTYRSIADESMKTSINCRDQPDMVLLLVCIVVASTVLINGTTMAPLMRVLNLTRPPDWRRYMRARALLSLRRVTEHYLHGLREMAGMGAGVDWVYVRSKLFNDVSRGQRRRDMACDDPNKAAWLTVLNLERSFYM